MTKRYAIWQFKHWLPLLFVFSIIILLSTLTTIFSNPVAYPTARYNDAGPFISTMALGSVIPAFLMTFVMPFFVYSYRTKRVYVDTFYQADLKEGAFRKIRLLIGLFFILAPFVASFLTGVLVHVMRYATTPSTFIINNPALAQNGIEYTRAAANFIVYLPQFFTCVLLLGASYSINCFLISLGDYILDQIFLLVFGTIFCGLLIISPSLFFFSLARNFSSDSTSILFFSLEPVGEIAMIAAFDRLFGCDPGWMKDWHFFVFLASALVHTAAGVVAFLYCFKKKDPSGEFADSRGARNTAISIVPHLGALSLGFLLSVVAGITGAAGAVIYMNTVNFIWQIFEYITFGVIYYCLLSLWRHSWKPSRMDLISFFIVMGITLVTMIMIMATATY